ncbi:MAG: PEP-CTERM sorting domain-containing protein [Verrucomicrobia bacterium]|nr:PEP-CTERM sorting domain-containing protein [Verrucomicrobiota bacterium]MCH8510275.1 PEP-CTERM sorting domain-containing protein [Kiritimatiellia bacterium]
MKTRHLKCIALLAMSAGLLIPSVSAALLAGDTVVINFTKDGNTAAGNWNNVEGASGGTIAAGPLFVDLIRFSDGTATGVDLSVEGSGLGAGLFGIGGRDESFDASRMFPVSGVIPAEAQENLTYHSATPQRFVFSGLDDGLIYNLSILSANTAGRDPHAWIANPGANQISITVDPDDGLVHTFFNLSTDGSGNIILENTSGSGGVNAQHINAMEFTAIPEPSTLLLLGIVGFALALNHRRIRVRNAECGVNERGEAALECV